MRMRVSGRKSQRNQPRQQARRALLGDTPDRNYAVKLRLFNAFAEPELRQLIAALGLKPGMRVLDAGCGTGETLKLLCEAIGQDGTAVGIDLAAPHTQAARTTVPAGAAVVQGDLQRLPLSPRTFDLIWSVNTINHFRDSNAAIQGLIALLRPGGRIVIGQSSLLPEMYFAWDSRLERLTTEAVRRYYRDRYAVSERDLTAARALLGWVRAAKLEHVHVHTVMIERTSPLDAASETYIVEAIFRGTWGARLRPYLSQKDYDELAALCDPSNPRFSLRRRDFHFLQTLTIVAGTLP